MILAATFVPRMVATHAGQNSVTPQRTVPRFHRHRTARSHPSLRSQMPRSVNQSAGHTDTATLAGGGRSVQSPSQSPVPSTYPRNDILSPPPASQCQHYRSTVSRSVEPGNRSSPRTNDPAWRAGRRCETRNSANTEPAAGAGSGFAGRHARFDEPDECVPERSQQCAEANDLQAANDKWTGRKRKLQRSMHS